MAAKLRRGHGSGRAGNSSDAVPGFCSAGLMAPLHGRWPQAAKPAGRNALSSCALPPSCGAPPFACLDVVQEGGARHHRQALHRKRACGWQSRRGGARSVGPHPHNSSAHRHVPCQAPASSPAGCPDRAQAGRGPGTHPSNTACSQHWPPQPCMHPAAPPWPCCQLRHNAAQPPSHPHPGTHPSGRSPAARASWG